MRLIRVLLWLRVEVLEVQLLHFGLLTRYVVLLRLLELLLGVDPDSLGPLPILSLNLAPELAQLARVLHILLLHSDLQLALLFELASFDRVLLLPVLIHLLEDGDALLKLINKLVWLFKLRLCESQAFFRLEKVCALED